MASRSYNPYEKFTHWPTVRAAHAIFYKMNFPAPQAGRARHGVLKRVTAGKPAPIFKTVGGLGTFRWQIDVPAGNREGKLRYDALAVRPEHRVAQALQPIWKTTSNDNQGVAP
ncbi:hypothetical protein [Noviherbaspirillum humi]|uniref:hypothetical protein n=1 Tax=Noviherbaspirillum humi TaxID=1688639 RepID=UPI001160AFEF|nr:hypothetical protein [Noviherbaspirillum humi]